MRHPDFLHLIRRSGSSLPPTSDQQLEEKVHAMFLRALTLRLPIDVYKRQIYLTLPVSVHPLLVLLPSAALLGLAVNLSLIHI